MEPAPPILRINILGSTLSSQPTTENQASPGIQITCVAIAALASGPGSSRTSTSQNNDTDSVGWSPRNRSLDGTRNSIAHEEVEGLKEAETVEENEGLEGIGSKLDKLEPMWFRYKTEKFYASALAMLEKTASQHDKPDTKPNEKVNAQIFALFDRLWEVPTVPSLGLEDAIKTVFLLGYACQHNHPLTRLSRIAKELKKWVPETDELPKEVDPILKMGLFLGLSRLQPQSSEGNSIRDLFTPLRHAFTRRA